VWMLFASSQRYRISLKAYARDPSVPSILKRQTAILKQSLGRISQNLGPLGIHLEAFSHWLPLVNIMSKQEQPVSCQLEWG
jgi:hypothetical protein